MSSNEIDPTLEEMLEALLADGWELGHITGLGGYHLRLSDWAIAGIEGKTVTSFLEGQDTSSLAAEKCYNALMKQYACEHKEWEDDFLFGAKQCIACLVTDNILEWRERGRLGMDAWKRKQRASATAR